MQIHLYWPRNAPVVSLEPTYLEYAHGHNFWQSYAASSRLSHCPRALDCSRTDLHLNCTSPGDESSLQTCHLIRLAHPPYWCPECLLPLMALKICVHYLASRLHSSPISSPYLQALQGTLWIKTSPSCLVFSSQWPPLGAWICQLSLWLLTVHLLHTPRDYLCHVDDILITNSLP
jgi:hypothetical protein